MGCTYKYLNSCYLPQITLVPRWSFIYPFGKAAFGELKETIPRCWIFAFRVKFQLPATFFQLILVKTVGVFAPQKSVKKNRRLFKKLSGFLLSAKSEGLSLFVIKFIIEAVR